MKILNKNEIFSKLHELSEHNTTKQYGTEIMPVNKNEIGSYQLKFSDDEMEQAKELLTLLYDFGIDDYYVQTRKLSDMPKCIDLITNKNVWD